jgi:hypothetical protein
MKRRPVIARALRRSRGAAEMRALEGALSVSRSPRQPRLLCRPAASRYDSYRLARRHGARLACRAKVKPSSQRRELPVVPRSLRLRALLSVQLSDLRWGARERARRADSGRSQCRAGTEMSEAQGTFVAARGIVELRTKRSFAPDRGQTSGGLTSTDRATPWPPSGRRCRSPR